MLPTSLKRRPFNIYNQYLSSDIYTSPPSPLKNPSSPEELVPSLIILSASPTCFRSVTSLECRNFRFICFLHSCVNPWELGPGAENPGDPLMTADCYCRGSEELDSLFRCRYTSVPYLWRVSRCKEDSEVVRTLPY
jgi:hypothetical protein